MASQLIYTQRARRDIRGLSAVIKQRVKIALEKYNDNPFFYAQKLTNPEFGTHRFCIGDYRVIFDLVEE